jgi:hypothetical protein
MQKLDHMKLIVEGKNNVITAYPDRIRDYDL